VSTTRARLLLKLAASAFAGAAAQYPQPTAGFRACHLGSTGAACRYLAAGRRVGSDSVLLFELPQPTALPVTGPGPCLYEAMDGAIAAELECARSEELLAALVDELDPDRGEPRMVSAENPEEKVLFFDFPGEGERSWRAAYRNEHESESMPISSSTRIRCRLARFDLVIQYWFFYPFNDGPNSQR
jgi:hypothetical protein